MEIIRLYLYFIGPLINVYPEEALGPNFCKKGSCNLILSDKKR